MSSYNQKYENPTNHSESEGKIIINRPLSESFLDPENLDKIWPHDIATNKVFLEQVNTRKELCESFDNIINHLPKPNISIENAILEGHTNEEQVTKFYTNLNNLLQSDKDYQRIILYLPFEFLPNDSWQPNTEGLQHSLKQFKESYLKVWNNLLSTHDVRANFVDGDVLEIEQRDQDLPRVVKVAHLIPKLVEKGWMKIEDVVLLMENSDDQILKNSIADTLPVLADLGFITEKEIELMKKSKDQLVKNMTNLISLDVKQKEQLNKATTPLELSEKLKENFEQIDATNYGKITKKREAWLKQKHKQEAIKTFGGDIAQEILEKKITASEMSDFLNTENNTANQQMIIEGIRQAVESSVNTDTKQAETFYLDYQNILLKLWENNNPETKELLAKTFRRLYQLNLISNQQLIELNITIPKLAGPFSDNLKNMNEDIQKIREIITSIELKDELMQLIYPVILTYSSRLKGYGEKNSDMDLGIFIKPETSFSDRSKLKRLLKEILTQKNIQDDVVEFWLEKKDNQLNIRGFENSDAYIGEKCWTHFLFNAAWEGDKNIINELCEKLLTPYLYDTNETIHERNARSLYLEQIEKSTLQYRLMHKGYEKFFPPTGGIHTPHSEDIDSDSMFYDSGYRQLATKLFLSKVFLPKIPNSGK